MTHTRFAQARWPLFYLATLGAAEFATATGTPWIGLGLHLATFFGLVIHASLAPSREQPLLLALVVTPLVRLASIALAFPGLPVMYLYLLSSLPLFAAGIGAARVSGLSRRELGLRLGSIRTQLGVALLGVPLGLAEYLILRPSGLIADLSWQSIWLPALVLLVSTGLLEEFLFRGVLQRPAQGLLGRFWGLIYVSAVFAVLHIGYLSAVDFVFVFGAGLLFAGIVDRTRSIVGVTFAHGLTNSGLYLVFPLIAAALGWS